MNIRVTKLANRTIAHCSGRLDAIGGPELENTLLPVIRSMDPSDLAPLILDVSDVNYISSAGIRTILFLYKAITKKKKHRPSGPRPCFVWPIPARRSSRCSPFPGCPNCSEPRKRKRKPSRPPTPKPPPNSLKKSARPFLSRFPTPRPMPISRKPFPMAWTI